VRRITLYRPGEKDVILVTNLCDAAAVPAVDLLEVYLNRWGIEMSHPDHPSSDSLYHGSRAA